MLGKFAKLSTAKAYDCPTNYPANVNLGRFLKHDCLASLKANSNYDGFQKVPKNACFTISLNSISSLTTKEMLFHLVTSVLESGIKSFGIKTKKIRKGKQFPKNVSDMIQMKKFLYCKLQEAHISDHTEIETMSS